MVEDVDKPLFCDDEFDRRLGALIDIHRVLDFVLSDEDASASEVFDYLVTGLDDTHAFVSTGSFVERPVFLYDRS